MRALTIGFFFVSAICVSCLVGVPFHWRVVGREQGSIGGCCWRMQSGLAWLIHSRVAWLIHGRVVLAELPVCSRSNPAGGVAYLAPALTSGRRKPKGLEEKSRNLD